MPSGIDGVDTGCVSCFEPMEASPGTLCVYPQPTAQLCANGERRNLTSIENARKVRVHDVCLIQVLLTSTSAEWVGIDVSLKEQRS